MFEKVTCATSHLSCAQLVSASNETLAKQPRYAGYFISELAHVVAFCDDRIPFCTLTVEVSAIMILCDFHGECMLAWACWATKIATMFWSFA